MNILICGAGEIGTHAADVLAAAGHSITIIDLDPGRLRAIEETMDVATALGSGTDSEILNRAGIGDADLLVAATNSDEVNLLCASIGKGLGARKCIARVHHAAFYEPRDFSYQDHLGIDRLICPEFATAQAIARRLRNPGAVALSNVARGKIEMQEFTASQSGSAIGMRLMDIHLPHGTRLAMIRRKKQAFIPEAKSVVVAGDSVILVGNADVFEDARDFFQNEKQPRRRVVLMGGPPMAVWLCRALRDRSFSLRLFERDRARAEELAEKLDWVTVIQADPTDRSVFDEESLAQADVFISLLSNDESNVVAGVLAKTRGVPEVITVLSKSKYLDVAYDIGVDQAFSTRHVGADEIEALLDESPLRHVGSLAEGSVDVYRVLVPEKAPVIGRPLREIKLSPDWVIAAIQRGRKAYVPGADDTLEAGDLLLVVGKTGTHETLKKLFGPG